MKISLVMNALGFYHDAMAQKSASLKRQITERNQQGAQYLSQNLVLRMQMFTYMQAETMVFYKILQILREGGAIQADQELESFSGLNNLMSSMIGKIQKDYDLSRIQENTIPSEKAWVKKNMEKFTTTVCETIQDQFSLSSDFCEVIDRVKNELTPIKNDEKVYASPALLFLHRKSNHKKAISSFASSFRDEQDKDGLLTPSRLYKRDNPTKVYGEFTVAHAMRELASYAKALDAYALAPPGDCTRDETWFMAWKAQAEVYYCMLKSCVDHKLVKLNDSIEACPFEDYFHEFAEKMRDNRIPKPAFTGHYSPEWEKKSEADLDDIKAEIEVLIEQLSTYEELHRDQGENQFVRLYQTLKSLAQNLLNTVEDYEPESVSRTALII